MAQTAKLDRATESSARTLGMDAFGKGIAATPCADSQLMDMVREFGTTSDTTCALMRAWLKGWCSANLAA